MELYTVTILVVAAYIHNTLYRREMDFPSFQEDEGN